MLLAAFLCAEIDFEVVHAKKNRDFFDLDGHLRYYFSGLHDDLLGYEELGRAYNP
jgi:hypothetical protein